MSRPVARACVTAVDVRNDANSPVYAEVCMPF